MKTKYTAVEWLNIIITGNGLQLTDTDKKRNQRIHQLLK